MTMAMNGWDKIVGGELRGQYVGFIIYKDIYKDIDITKDHDRRVLAKVVVSQEEKSSRSEVIFGR